MRIALFLSFRKRKVTEHMQSKNLNAKEVPALPAAAAAVAVQSSSPRRMMTLSRSWIWKMATLLLTERRKILIFRNMRQCWLRVEMPQMLTTPQSKTIRSKTTVMSTGSALQTMWSL